MSEEYALKISAGPDYDHLATVNVNDCENPIFINSAHFCGYLLVRVRDFTGISSEMEKGISNIPKRTPTFPYFTGKNRRYSMAVQGRFKETYNADEIIFGGDLDKYMSPPPGTALALKIAKWLDPAMDASTGGGPDSGHYLCMFSPMVTAMNSLSVLDVDSDYLPQDMITTSAASSPLPVGKWSFHDKHIPEDASALTGPHVFATYEKRKKYFIDKSTRENTMITPDHIYAMDFYDAFFDVNTATIRLPGFSMSALKYWNGQKLRYSLLTRDKKTVFFCVVYEFVKKIDIQKQ